MTNDGTVSTNATNFMGGGQVGCNWQSATYVVGLEGDFDYFPSNTNLYNNTNTLPISGNNFAIGQTDHDHLSFRRSARAQRHRRRPQLLSYITGGAAFTSVNYTESYTDLGGGALGSVTDVEIPGRLDRRPRAGNTP